jgi:hypothetical protein
MQNDRMPDGIYRTESGSASYNTRTIIVVHNGAFFGIGEMGAHYRGTFKYDPVRKVHPFDCMVTFPPNTPLVTGGKIGPQGAVMPFQGEVKVQLPRSRFSYLFDGRAIDVALTYVRPLPG